MTEKLKPSMVPRIDIYQPGDTTKAELLFEGEHYDYLASLTSVK